MARENYPGAKGLGLKPREAGSFLQRHYEKRQLMNSLESQEVTHARRSGCAGIGIALIGAVLSLLYLANLTFGVVEIPDNLPLIGNIDEVLVSGILFTCLSRLGINPIPNFRRNDSVPPARPKR